jgi:DNA mismatch repair protein MutS2
MNRLRGLEIAEAREVQRILRELTNRMRPHHAELVATLDALIVLDSLFARARYALAVNGARPVMLPAGSREYHVVHGYHPLLRAGDGDVVPFDLTLHDDERTLLVSGPNTGGKTVLLKAIGLISALAQSGVIPPVGQGTRLPLFTDVFADIGDEQSIEASLSTFSAHLVNLREILEHATAESLVLIDEMGSGTDPAEGGALAQAILVELNRRGTLTCATTHLGQLKLLAGEEPGVVNASLQFDAAELMPTYRLQKGVPGRSYGLAIARRLGFPTALLSRAEEFLPQTERDASNLLLELEEKERALAESLSETRAARADAVELRARLEQRDQELRRRERDAERRARQQARDLLLGAREEVESAIRELRETAASASSPEALDDAIRAARRHVEERAQVQAERMPDEAEQAQQRTSQRRSIEVGARVRIAATGAEGVVVELRDRRAVVEAGGVRLQVATSGLERLAGQPSQPARPAARSSWTGPDVDASSEVDLRGMRADEAVPVLTRALDAAILAGLPSLRIIHGKGTGALREVVTDVLRGERRVSSFRPGGLGEGGTGVTVAELA